MVTNLDDHRPHLVIATGDKKVHVIPVLALERVVSGEIAITDIDDYEEIFRTILAEWLSFTGATK